MPRVSKALTKDVNRRSKLERRRGRERNAVTNKDQSPKPDASSRGTDTASLREIVVRLRGAPDGLSGWPSAASQVLPSRDALADIVEALRGVLFPGFFGEQELSEESLGAHLEAALDHVRHELQRQVRRGLYVTCQEPDPWRCTECDERSVAMTQAFLGRLPEVRRLLCADVQAAYTGDPAATSPSETVLCYPGIHAMTNYRLAHELHVLGVPLLPRMITESAHSTTGIDIHPGTTIGERFFMDHGTGIVIGETAVIGSRVRIYQGVTLGAKSFPLDEHGHPIKGIPRHPVIEDDVIIYSGATILGRITVGAGSVIGGNVWLTHDVPPGSRISQVEPR
jgi:serine O-acetyltransferase